MYYITRVWRGLHLLILGIRTTWLWDWKLNHLPEDQRLQEVVLFYLGDTRLISEETALLGVDQRLLVLSAQKRLEAAEFVKSLYR